MHLYEYAKDLGKEVILRSLDDPAYVGVSGQLQPVLKEESCPINYPQPST